jgi:hypothetical protein
VGFKGRGEMDGVDGGVGFEKNVNRSESWEVGGSWSSLVLDKNFLIGPL